jgi:hypothetical protein
MRESSGSPRRTTVKHPRIQYPSATGGWSSSAGRLLLRVTPVFYRAAAGHAMFRRGPAGEVF